MPQWKKILNILKRKIDETKKRQNVDNGSSWYSAYEGLFFYSLLSYMIESFYIKKF